MAVSSSLVQPHTTWEGSLSLPSTNLYSNSLRTPKVISSVFGSASHNEPVLTISRHYKSRRSTDGSAAPVYGTSIAIDTSAASLHSTYSTSNVPGASTKRPSFTSIVVGSSAHTTSAYVTSTAAVPVGTDYTVPVQPSSSAKITTHIIPSNTTFTSATVLPHSTDLPQSLTNGDTLLGTLDAPTYPIYLGTNYPWGQDNTNNTDPYHNSPNTGVTRYFDFTISNTVIYPDGYKKSVLLINNQFPGPMLDVNWGDTVSVTVHNNMTGESPQMTALHWHGILQHNTQWYDGSPGLGQCPIAPGDSLTYTWKAELYGSSWYHSHLSAQWPQGMFGPLLVYGPQHVDYDIDLGPVFLSDWYHQSAEVVIRQLLEPKDRYVDIPSDNNLINGKNPLPCSDIDAKNDICRPGAPYAKFKFQKGKKHKLRLINSGAQAVQKFSIDGHKLKVIANDFVPIKPYYTNVVTLGVGQRSDVIVEADQDDEQSYWMRSNSTCANNNNPFAKAIIYYYDAHSTRNTTKIGLSSVPTTTSQEDDSVGRNLPCSNDPLNMTEPMYKMPVKQPSITQVFKAEFKQNSTGSWVWYMNNNSYLTDFNNPTLNLLSDYNQTYLLTSDQRNPYYIPDNATSYRFILQNETPSSHPIHHHGHNSYVLYESDRPWTDEEAMLLESRIVRRENPQRRDVQQVPGGGYLVLQFDADNPGSWGFHCHMAFHIGGGFFTEAIEGTNQLLGKPVPENVLTGCSNFRAWNDANLASAKVYDSGQKL